MNAPWRVSLPTTLTVGGEEKAIRSDYRAALDCFLALSDPELDSYERAAALLGILYVDDIPPKDWQEALERAFWFLRGGEDEDNTKQLKLVEWSQDFNLIASPISNIVGQDIRGLEYYHFWSFLSAYMGVGDCLFAQVVSIRDKLARGKKLEKHEREWYNRNKRLVDFREKYTEAEDDFLKSLAGK